MAVVREAYGFVHADRSPLKDVYGGPSGQVFVECMRVRPARGEAKTAIPFSHPIGGGSFLPLVTALAHGGRHVVYCNPRYRGNDTALILEKCLLDLGACVQDLKRRFGYEPVVLGGWSGGGSLSLFYQDQAEQPTITATPSGDPVDVAGAGLQPADAILLLAAHISRSVTLTEWIFTTLRSWLSQWSLDESRADGLGNASRITCPVLVVNNRADLACTPSHAQRLFDAVASMDKEIVQIDGADHYYIDRPDLLPTAVATVGGWLDRHGF